MHYNKQIVQIYDYVDWVFDIISDSLISSFSIKCILSNCPKLYQTPHEAFFKSACNEIAESCKGGKIGCVECKQLVANQIDLVLEPMRERRQEYRSKPNLIDQILLSGTERAKAIAEETMKEVRDAMQINYFNKQ